MYCPLHMYCCCCCCVYCHHQTYNDLGKDNMPRPTLGGSEWPYPRRLATHTASQGPDGKGVEPNVKQPWLPYDEAFSFTKVCLILNCGTC